MIQALPTLIAAGESQTLEFKASFDKACIATLVALANYRSSLRNKLVAEGFYLINVIEKYGSGFIRIRRALQDYPEVHFDVQEFQGGVMATFTLTKPELPDGGASGGVSGGANDLLSYIQAHPGQRSNEMVIALNTPLRSIERGLKQLKENGQVEFRGATKTGGYYRKKL